MFFYFFLVSRKRFFYRAKSIILSWASGAVPIRTYMLFWLLSYVQI